jgi:hypothetical protein
LSDIEKKEFQPRFDVIILHFFSSYFIHFSTYPVK